VFLFYEKAVKSKFEEYKMNAIILFNALVCSSQSESRAAANKKSRAWSRFVDSLDWNKITKKKTVKDVTQQFFGLGIPILPKKKDKGES